ACWTADGLPDAGFGRSGHVTVAFGKASAIPWDVAAASHGRIVVAGEVADADGDHQDVAGARLGQDGHLDKRFGAHGFVRTPVKGSYAAGWSVMVGEGDGIVVGGDAREADGSHDHGLLARYRSDGQRAEAFSGDGVELFHPSEAQRLNDAD